MGPRRPLTTWPRAWRRRGKRGLFAAFLLACGFLLMWPTLTGWATVLLQGPHQGPYPPTTDACASCHRSHTARRAYLLITGGGGGGGRVNPAIVPMSSDEQFCYTCHNGTGATQVAVVSAHGNMAPLGENEGDAASHHKPAFRIGCTACHDPHGSSNAQDIRTELILPHFSHSQRVRLGPVVFQGTTGKHSFDDGESPANSRLCVVCHEAVGTLRHPGGADHLGHFDFTGQNCLTCHPHSVDGIPSTADGFMPSPEARQQLIERARVDLEVQQHSPETPVVAGQPFDNVLEVFNRGPQDAWDVRLTVELPQGVAVSQMPAGLECTSKERQLTCALGDLPVGERRVLALTLLPEVSLDGELAGEVTVSALQRDPQPENNHIVLLLPCERQADLALALKAPAQVITGETARYTLTVQNQGPSLAEEVMLQAAWPAGTRLQQAASSQGTCVLQPAENRVVCNVASLAPKATVEVVVDAEAASGGAMAVQGEVTATTADPQPDNNAATALVAVEEGSALKVAVQPEVQRVAPNADFDYIVTVRNAGVLPAEAVVLESSLPAGGVLRSATPSQGTCALASEGGLQCSLGAVEPGAVVTVRVTAQAPAEPTTLRLLAAVSPPEEAPSWPRHTAEAALAVIAGADVQVLGEAPPTAVPGATWQWPLEVRNAGPQAATDVKVALHFPETVAVEAVTLSQGQCEQEGEGWACALEALLSGATADLVATIRALPDAEGEVVLAAEAVAVEEDFDQSNNRLEASVGLSPQADLAVALEDAGEGELVSGEARAFVLTVSNQGPSRASQVVARVSLPEPLRFVGVVGEREDGASTCQWDEGDAAVDRPPAVVCQWEGLLPEETVTVALAVEIGVVVASEMEVVVQGSSSVTDLWPENNTARLVFQGLLPTPTATATFTPTPGAEATATPTPTPTFTPTPGDNGATATATPTPTGAPSPTPSPTVLPTATPTPTSSPVPTPTPTPTPTLTPTPTPTATSAP